MHDRAVHLFLERNTMKHPAILLLASAVITLSGCVVVDDGHDSGYRNNTSHRSGIAYKHDYYDRNNESYRRMNEHQRERFRREQQLRIEQQHGQLYNQRRTEQQQSVQMQNRQRVHQPSSRDTVQPQPKQNRPSGNKRRQVSG